MWVVCGGSLLRRQLSPVAAWRLKDDEEMWMACEWWSDVGRVIVVGGGGNGSSSSSSSSSIYDKQMTFNPNVINDLMKAILQTPPSQLPGTSICPPFINTTTYPCPPRPPSSPLPRHHPDRPPSPPLSPWTHLSPKYHLSQPKTKP